jgi:hypothetical protein
MSFIIQDSIVPKGVYTAKVTKIEPELHEQYGERVQIHFELNEKKYLDGRPMTIFRSVNWKFGQKSHLRAVVSGILGRELTQKEASDGFDLEQLIGMESTISVVHKKNQQNGNPYAWVDSIASMDAEEKDTEDNEE